MPRLEATFDVTRLSSNGLHVVGRVSATVGQVCVVTLDPIENEVEEMVDLMNASRSYQANVASMSAVKDMIMHSIDLLH